MEGWGEKAYNCNWITIKIKKKKPVVHLHHGILHSRKKEGAATLCDILDGTGEHYAKWSKPGGERQLP